MMELSPIDLYRIKMCPPGWRYTLVLISYAKWIIAPAICPVDVRLRTLEYFEKWSSEDWLDATMIGLIEPMPDPGNDIIRESLKLGWKKAFDVWGKTDVFTALVVINPSLLAAIVSREGRAGWTENVIQQALQTDCVAVA